MKFCITIIVNVIFLLSCFSQSDELKKIYDLSEEIKFIDLHEFIYNRIGRYQSRNSNRSMIEFVENSKLLKDDQIDELLSNSNSKIRALGILCLYQTNNHKNLLRIAKYIGDTTNWIKPIHIQDLVEVCTDASNQL